MHCKSLWIKASAKCINVNAETGHSCCVEEEICSLFENVCFIISAITVVGCLDACTVTAKNTLPLAPRTERGAWRFKRGSLRVGPATASLGLLAPLPVL